MDDKQKRALALLGLGVGAVLIATSRPRKVSKYVQQAGTMTAIQLAQAYRELVSSPLRVFINPTDESNPETGMPWAVDLAHYTKSYEAVKAEYLKYYGRDLSEDLIAWFYPAELSQYVDALWKAHQQVMS
ncbi:hypothetical protein [Dyadobacter sp. 676]|uniref:Uncharacterized protein n=1 Tax=Dyadobacter sp. 676 TaxID=3088362 RepID=A0AAU8FMU0_9BACT